MVVYKIRDCKKYLAKMIDHGYLLISYQPIVMYKRGAAYAAPLKSGNGVAVYDRINSDTFLEIIIRRDA